MDKVFLNFPITLLRPAFNNMKRVCIDIIDYAVYRHSLTLQGNELKKVKDSAHYFDITLGNALESLKNGKDLYQSYKEKPVMTGISRDLLSKYLKNDKSDFEIALLLSFLAAKSILGKKSFCRVTSETLLCRMAGYASKSELKELTEPLKKYQTRYHLDSLKFELKKSFGLKIYGRYTRGFFISFELPEEQLIKEVEMKRKKYYE